MRRSIGIPRFSVHRVKTNGAKDPVVRELQLIQPTMFEAKKVGHHEYDRQKDITDVAKNSSALTAEDKRVLQEESDKIDRYMAELYDAAYAEDTKSGSEYPSATPALKSNLPTLTIESMGPNGRFSLDSTPSMKEASDLLLVLSSTHLSAARLSSTDIAANFFSVSGNIVGASTSTIPPSTVCVLVLTLSSDQTRLAVSTQLQTVATATADATEHRHQAPGSNFFAGSLRSAGQLHERVLDWLGHSSSRNTPQPSFGQ